MRTSSGTSPTDGRIGTGVESADARRRDRAVVALAMVSGATDAIGFLALGSAFTSVMTGNMVLVGIAVGTGDGSAVGLVLTAIVSYMLGAAIGTRVAGQPQSTDTAWPSSITRALLLELVLVTAFAIAWWSTGSAPSAGWYAPLLALNAAALGVQSSAIMRFGVSGLSTTYLTGTLTTVVVRLASGQRLHTVGHPARILVALVAGAAAGATLVSHAAVAAPVFQLSLLVGAVLVGWRCHRAQAAP